MFPPSQIALPLAPARAAARRIVIGAGNEDAVAALSRPQDWPYRTLVLTGPARSGKSLLAEWFAATGRGAAIDGADGWDEAELFHRWNRAQEEARPLLLVGDRTPWAIRLPDLASRLGGSAQVALQEPDDAMALDLIEAHAEQRRMTLPDGAAEYLLARITRSHAAVEEIVGTIDRLSYERKAPASRAIWRDALELVQGERQARLL